MDDRSARRSPPHPPARHSSPPASSPPASSPPASSPRLDCGYGRQRGCATYCCRLIVRLAPGERDPERPDRAGQSCLDKGADGLCVHLDRDTHACSVWEQRPSVCRAFDCNQDPLLQIVARDGFDSLTRLVTAEPADTLRLRVPAFCTGQAAELEALAARYEAIPDQEARQDAPVAEEIAALKERIAAVLAGVESCTTCGRRSPPPAGWSEGGACCCHDVRELFGDDELWILRAAGRGAALRGPGYAESGCAFRRPEGCSLPPGSRPCACLHYLCDSLRDELRTRGTLDRVETLCNELEAKAAEIGRSRRLREAMAELARIL